MSAGMDHPAGLEIKSSRQDSLGSTEVKSPGMNDFSVDEAEAEKVDTDTPGNDNEHLFRHG